MHYLQQIIENLGYRTMSYSGRGMFGKQCLAANLDCSVIQFIAEITDYAVNESATSNLITAIKQAKQDQLGLGIVVYFPGIQYDGSNASENHEDIDD